MHSIETKTVIGTQESVYRDSPTGKLEEGRVVETMLAPLQQGFDSNSQARLPVAVYYLPALALEQGIVAAVTVPDSTAAGTPFARMPLINHAQSNAFVEASLFKDLPEFEERDTHDSLVKLPAYGLEPGKVFNSDVSVEPQRYPSDFCDDLTEIGLHEIMLRASQLPEFLLGGVAAFVGVALEDAPASHEMLSPCPYLLAEVGLVENLACWTDDGDCEVLGVDVDAEDIPALREDGILFGEEGDQLKPWRKTDGLAFPTVAEKALEAFEVPIWLDWNADGFAWVSDEFYELSAFGESLAVARDVELDCYASYASSLTTPNGALNIADDLGVEGGVGFGC